MCQRAAGRKWVVRESLIIINTIMTKKIRNFGLGVGPGNDRERVSSSL
jgi:hypothetical protein